MWIQLLQRDVDQDNMVEDMEFSMYDQEYDLLVEGVTQLQNIGKTLEQTYNGCLVVHRNIGKLWLV